MQSFAEALFIVAHKYTNTTEKVSVAVPLCGVFCESLSVCMRLIFIFFCFSAAIWPRHQPPKDEEEEEDVKRKILQIPAFIHLLTRLVTSGIMA